MTHDSRPSPAPARHGGAARPSCARCAPARSRCCSTASTSATCAIGGTELVRRVYTAVRDVDWDTVPGEISGFELDAARRLGFDVEFDVRHARRDIDFAWHGTIIGRRERPRRRTASTAARDGDLPYNRIGICVHHPWRETAGARFRARTPEGEIEGVVPRPDRRSSAFEDGAYHALFPAFDRLEVDLAAGGSLLLEFEGDLWETEDHRNWTDANFKTYSTPIALGRPAPLEAGADAPAAARDHAARRSRGEPCRRRARCGSRSARPRERRVPADRPRPGPRRPRARRRASASVLAALAPRTCASRCVSTARTGARRSRPAGDGGAIGAHARALAPPPRGALPTSSPRSRTRSPAGPPVDRVLVMLADGRTATPEETTPPALVDVARAGARQRRCPTRRSSAAPRSTSPRSTAPGREPATWDGVCYSISPQIHAFTDIDVMENLDAQARDRAQRARARRRQAGRRLADHAAPPRQLPRRGRPAADAARRAARLGRRPPVRALRRAPGRPGSLKYLSEAGASSVTYYETTGWRGVVERADGLGAAGALPLARRGGVPALPPARRRRSAGAGRRFSRCESSDVLSAVGLAVRGRRRDAPARGQPDARRAGVAVAPLEGEVALRRLNEYTAGEAASDPEEFRRRRETAAADGELTLMLAPYEVVRIDPA